MSWRDRTVEGKLPFGHSGADCMIACNDRTKNTAGEPDDPSSGRRHRRQDLAAEEKLSVCLDGLVCSRSCTCLKPTTSP